jgi:hypothetical protein
VSRIGLLFWGHDTGEVEFQDPEKIAGQGGKMKKIALGWTLLFSLLVSPLFAQVSPEFQKTRELMQKQKDEVISADMKLTKEEGKAFWPLYREYQEALGKLQDRLFRLLAEYARERENATFTDQKARVLLDEYLDMEREDLWLKRAHLEKFSRILPAKKVMRYFQLENKISAMVKYQMTQGIPLAK